MNWCRLATSILTQLLHVALGELPARLKTRDASKERGHILWRAEGNSLGTMGGGNMPMSHAAMKNHRSFGGTAHDVAIVKISQLKGKHPQILTNQHGWANCRAEPRVGWFLSQSKTWNKPKKKKKRNPEVRCDRQAWPKSQHAETTVVLHTLLFFLRGPKVVQSKCVTNPAGNTICSYWRGVMIRRKIFGGTCAGAAPSAWCGPCGGRKSAWRRRGSR